jgi:hypothetical protein
MATPATVEYFGISIFSSRIFWLNLVALVVAVLSATDVAAIIPARFLPLASAVIAAGNIGLRLVTVRPAVLIAPGTTAPVSVPKLTPPAPPLVTD